jgi:predicted DCC family thiol-disulfide oxidoreductase YuxK
MSKNENTNKPVLLIDSDCKFCSKSVQFIIKHGGEDKYHFYSLNSDEGRKFLRKYDFPEDYIKSIVLIENEKAYIKSDAALKISKNLNGILPAIYWLRIIPKPIRDAVYNFVSRHRHSII